MNDQQDTTPEPKTDQTPPVEPDSNDDLRYAPPVEGVSDFPALPDEMELETAEESSVTDELDIEAALAAVSTLSDLVAEQEAAEQARIAQEEIEAQLRAERQARLEHPERFFPVPPLTTLHRGQMASVVPAVLLILIGVWLTFTLTTTHSLPDAGLLAVVAAGSLALTWVVRWLSSARWGRGSLFFALAMLLLGLTGAYLLQPASPGLTQGWPLLLVALGAAIILTALLSQPTDRGLLLPGTICIVAGVAGLVIAMQLLSGDFLNIAAALWPAAVIAVVVLWLLPIVFRQRQ